MTTNWKNIYKKYKGLWVTLDKNETKVISSGKTLKAAMDQAVKKGFKDPIVMNVPKDVVTYVGGIR